MFFGALRSIIRPASRILSSASHHSSAPKTTFSSATTLPELRHQLVSFRLPWITQCNAFRSLCDNRIPERMKKHRRKRADMKPPGPYVWVKCEPGEPISPNQPNKGSVKHRLANKRKRQRLEFIRSEKKKRKIQLQQAKKRKIAKEVERTMAAVARDRAWAIRLVELKRIEEQKKAAAAAKA